ncbi:MAG: 30S ribosomal protein S16 [candidate division WOR-3 bacterium]|nr:30S ribosomal protein S16 [candidate division WOR-3 bacterium]MCR4423564.1 30S ribosomal protein S16 [candidate division WOR-3 bacterium]MDH7518903.1 30S ribosomal protein S16 [bacterium]
MVKIRLTRLGARNKPAYRVVAIDSRRARDSKYLEALGHYDPRRKILKLNLERVDYWLSRGAQPSNTVDRLIKRYRKMVPVSPVPEEGGTGAESDPVRPTEPTN